MYGLNLYEASYVIFLDHPWNEATYNQCIDRAHRIGQTKNVTIINLLCKYTIDEKIFELMKKKGELSDILVDGKLDNIDKKQLVNFLLS